MYDSSWFIMIHHDSSWFIMIHHDSSWFILSAFAPQSSTPCTSSHLFVTLHLSALLPGCSVHIGPSKTRGDTQAISIQKWWETDHEILGFLGYPWLPHSPTATGSSRPDPLLAFHLATEHRAAQAAQSTAHLRTLTTSVVFVDSIPDMSSSLGHFNIENVVFAHSSSNCFHSNYLFHHVMGGVPGHGIFPTSSPSRGRSWPRIVSPSRWLEVPPFSRHLYVIIW